MDEICLLYMVHWYAVAWCLFRGMEKWLVHGRIACPVGHWDTLPNNGKKQAL